MNFLINFTLLIFVYFFNFDKDNNYKYILILTSKNCSPCIVTADEFFAKNTIKYRLINLYQNKAEKKYSEETIKNFCKESKHSKYISKLGDYSFGKYKFNAFDGGPYVIKYSNKDTIIYDAQNIELINIK